MLQLQPGRMLWFVLLVIAALQPHVVHGSFRSAVVQPSKLQHSQPQSAPAPLAVHKGPCAPAGAIPVQGLNLTAREVELLPDICWRQDLLAGPAPGSYGLRDQHRGVPPGVKCNVTQWCDPTSNECTDVCARGSVVVDAWLRHAVQTQLGLARRLPFCYAALLGTHNSGITMADGYGNLDPHFQEYFKWIKWIDDHAVLQTNDQWLSMTDQLNAGVRSLELDTHWVREELRIAHCGGFHSELDKLVAAVNFVARLLGKDFQWDTETIGCDPSLSSIPAAEQRPLGDALAEVAAWLAQPGNQAEFVVLYLDNQMDLLDWGLVPRLLATILATFPQEVIYTPGDRAQADAWPSIDDMVAAGKRVLFVSGSEYGQAMDALVFSRHRNICGWAEPELRDFVGPPTCQVSPAGGPTLQGMLYRQTTCELQYGPLNCDMIWGTPDWPLLDEATLPDVTHCGLNMPSPDAMTPQRAAATIWSWAPGHPPPANPAPLPRPPGFAARWAAAVRNIWQPRSASNEGACATVSAQDGRWRVADCSTALPTACRRVQAWPVVAAADMWQLAAGERGACPQGSLFEVPYTAKENLALQTALQAAGSAAAWLPITGPSWQVTWSTAGHQAA